MRGVWVISTHQSLVAIRRVRYTLDSAAIALRQPFSRLLPQRPRSIRSAVQPR